MLVQLSGQGRLAVGAILGAATAALFLVGLTTGPEPVAGRAEVPLAMTDPGSSGTSEPAVPAGGSTMTAVVSATVAATTTTASTSKTTTTAGPTSVPVVTSVTPPATTVPPTTTTRPSRTRRPPTKPPCFLFC
ncbi:MAG TPA: hypothetical protein VEO01_35285 [Pseudonocardiaceae bacterium]|nr:hypothetical protein [Pseudonocardiaceae bacterium]